MARIPLKLYEGEGASAPSEGGEGPGAQVEEDPILEECVRDALDLFPGVLSPEDAAEHRRFLTAFILTHPAARPLYERLVEARRVRPTNASSGPVAKDGKLIESESEVGGDAVVGRRR